ncbi:hypothetical protein Lalb_Chr20g0121381 [Lupinus albus]|uniref:Uncharacterized protein n=1 Tax=Lupinus albus TaxID=3870 RepID=A0A6A4NZ80_LUPAL|nr:hypothetical protein Lalb_Chr20g0121381 [Lupinus albus]
MMLLMSCKTLKKCVVMIASSNGKPCLCKLILSSMLILMYHREEHQKQLVHEKY